MPIHDWIRVEAGIFHDFHHEWISTIRQALSKVLPDEYYALVEQQAAGFGPDVLTLQAAAPDPDSFGESSNASGSTTLQQAPPQARFKAQWNRELFRRKKSTIVVRHISGDNIVAVVEIISPGNKASRRPFQSLLDKAVELLEHKIHLLILDLLPPSPRDPRGLHSALWEEITTEVFVPPSDKPLTLAAYESDLFVNAFIEPVAVGDRLPDMPLFLQPGAYVLVPLEATYREAFERMPARWRGIVEREEDRF